MSDEQIRAGLYARISDDREQDEKGVRRQIKDERALVTARGGTVVMEQIDNDISALKGKRRDGYDAIMAAAEDGRITHIVVWQLSRLWRNRRERAEGIERLAKVGVSVLAARGPDLDLTTASGRMLAGILGEFDTAESEIKGERVRAKVLELAEAGAIANGGPRPFGYTRVYSGEGPRRKILRDEIEPDEADIIRDAAKRLLDGESLRTIVGGLNADGVATSTGGRWSMQGMRHILRSGRIAGLREHQGVVIGAAVWPAIITPDQHRLLRAHLDGNVRPPGNRVRAHFLTGVVFCGRCSVRMGVKPHTSGKLRYVCKPKIEGGCNGVVVALPELQFMVATYITRRLDTVAFKAELAAREQVDDQAGAKIRARMDQDEARLAAFSAALSTVDPADVPEAVAEVAATRKRIAAGRVELAKLAGVPAEVRDAVGVTVDEFMAMPLDTKRTILRFLVERIVVGPAVRGRSTFDPDRVDIISA